MKGSILAKGQKTFFFFRHPLNFLQRLKEKMKERNFWPHEIEKVLATPRLEFFGETQPFSLSAAKTEARASKSRWFIRDHSSLAAMHWEACHL